MTKKGFANAATVVKREARVKKKVIDPLIREAAVRSGKHLDRKSGKPRGCGNVPGDARRLSGNAEVPAIYGGAVRKEPSSISRHPLNSLDVASVSCRGLSCERRFARTLLV